MFSADERTNALVANYSAIHRKRICNIDNDLEIGWKYLMGHTRDTIIKFVEGFWYFFWLLRENIPINPSIIFSPYYPTKRLNIRFSNDKGVSSRIREFPNFYGYNGCFDTRESWEREDRNLVASIETRSDVDEGKINFTSPAIHPSIIPVPVSSVFAMKTV